MTDSLHIDPANGVTADPAGRVRAAYRAAASRMSGIPILNPRLTVEAVGFRRWQGQWLGALITPWCLNVMLVPDDPAEWPAIAAGDKRVVRFPAGTYEFIAGRDEILGEHHDLSLFSPVLEFEDALAARLTAEAALDALLDAGNDRAQAPVQEPAPITKRQFLRGEFIPPARGTTPGDEP